MHKEKPFGPRQTYTALNTVKTYDDRYCSGEFEKFVIKVNKDALLKYKRVEQNDLFSTIKRNFILGNAVTALAYSVRSLLRHVDDIVSDIKVVNNNIIGFTETGIQPLGST